MRSLAVPGFIVAATCLLAAGSALSEEAEGARRMVVGVLWMAAAAAVAIAVAGSPGGAWAAMEQSPIGAGAGALVATGTALALGRARASSPVDVAAPLIGIGVAGAWFALQTRYLVPALLYLMVPVAAAIAARPRRRAAALAAAGALAAIALALGALRHGMGGWALPWRPDAASVATATAALALVAALALAAAGTLFGLTADGRGDALGAAAGWPVVVVGGFVAMMMGGAIAGTEGAAPGALVVLALAGVVALAGSEMTPLWAVLITAGVALAPGCGPGTAAIVGAGAFLAVLLEGSGIDFLRRYGRWCASGLPGGALFPGLAVAALAIARAPAPGGARVLVIVALVVALALRLVGPTAPVLPAGPWGNVGAVAIALGAVWLSLMPGSWQHGWAEPGAAALFQPPPADITPLGGVLGAAAVATLLLGIGVGLVATLPPRPTPATVGPGELPIWRVRLGRALVEASPPALPGWAAVAALSFAGLISLRLLAVGARAGFL